MVQQLINYNSEVLNEYSELKIISRGKLYLLIDVIIVIKRWNNNDAQF